MGARRGSWVLAGVLTYGFAGLASAQKLVPAQPPGTPKPADPTAKAPAVQSGGLPAGALARLGKTRLRHAEPPTCVAFAPDGKTFFTGGQDGSIRAWSVATGEIVNIAQKPAMGVAVLRFTHGGTRVAVHHNNESIIRFLDPKTLREVGSAPFINKHRFGFSTDGKFMITSDAVGNAVVTEVEGDLPKLELTGADRFDFRPDGKAVAVGDSKGNVTVHLVTGGKPTFALKGLGTVYGLAYSADGKRLAVGARSLEGNDTVRVYEDKNEKPVAVVTGMNLPRAWTDSDSLAVGNGTDVGVYDIKKKDWTGRVRGAPGEFAVSPDGTKLVATGNGGGLRVRLWDLTTGKQMHAENDSFPDPALMIGSADCKSLFLLATDTAYLWPIGAESAKTIGTLPGVAVSAAASSGMLVVATADAVIVYANFDPLKPLPAKPTFTFEKSAGAKLVAVSPDGRRVAWAVDGGKVTIADASDKKPRTELPVTAITIRALAFDPTGAKLAVCERTHLRLWDVTDLGGSKELWSARRGSGLKAAICFSPDGKLIAAASLAQVPVFNTADGSEVFKADRYSEDGYAQHATFSPDNRLLIFGSGGTSGCVEVWEMATRGMVRKFTTGYGGISRLCVFPDGTRLASAGAEEAVTVWDLTYGTGKSAPKADELLTAWGGLDSLDAAIGYPAIKLLATAGDRGTETISRGTKDLLVTQRKIKAWVEDLGSKTFTIREVASKELLSLGIRALPAVKAATRSEEPEVRDRALELLRKLQAKGLTTPESGLAGDALRLVRAVQALEEIGTAQAKSVLGEIATAGGAPGDEAKAALARLKKK